MLTIFGRLPEPEYVDADAVLLARGEAPVIERPGLAQPEATEEPEPEPRYAPITAEEREIIARVVHLEANNQPFEGQQAVAEVVLNRRAAGNFADSVHDVVYAPGQFSTAPILERVEPNMRNYTAVWLALYGEAILPLDVVYFSRGAENGNVWGQIGAHVFCYQYVWG